MNYCFLPKTFTENIYKNKHMLEIINIAFNTNGPDLDS